MPGRRTMVSRPRTTGFASRASGRSSAMNGRSSRTTGFDASTSGSTVSSVARRFTKVVLALRMNGGSCSMALASACFSLPIAAWWR